MAICKKCGHSIPDDAVACPNCGKPVKGKRKKNKKKKNNGGTIALVIIFIVFILGIAGSIVFLLIRETEPQLSTFGVNCAEFSDALNRVLEAEHSDKFITSSKWSANDAHTAFDYDGGSFVMHAKTAKNNDVSSKIRELRIGPTNTEDGVTMAALSAVALETGLNKDTVLRNMAEVKAMTRDKISYEAVSFTFDRTKDEYVLVPGNGTKSDDYHATSDQAALPEFNTTAFVAGNGFVSAGEKYVFSGGSGIRFRDKITDNNTVITKAANDGQLLTDGNVVYYIKKVQKERQVFSVGLDGSGEQMLLSLPEDVTLIHVRNNTLYYALADAQTPDVCTLWKYRLDTMENTKLEEVSFAPQRTLVCGELLYCSLSDDPDADLQLSAAYAFNFDTEEFSEAIPHCQVAQHGYITGIGAPCMDSFLTDSTGLHYTDHYLYTAVDGKLQKSPEIKVDAQLLLACPKSDDAILYDSHTAKYYLFNRKTGKTDELTVPAAGSFIYDIDKPEDIYFFTVDAASQNRALSGIYKLESGALIPYYVHEEMVSLGAHPVIVSGYILDSNFDAYPITDQPPATEPPTEALTEPVTEAAAEPAPAEEAAEEVAEVVGE